MNGAESLVRTLVACGVEVCFANPGTSEMHFVAALDRVDGMRCILTLFEGVATGAADGWGRMMDRPAATLLHLGPGLANGLANLHNACKAMTPIVNIVGEHATYHRQYNTPLSSDVETVAQPFSSWVHVSPDARLVAAAGAEAVAASLKPPGGVATLILPADTAWNESNGPAPMATVAQPIAVSGDAIVEAARILRSGEPTLLLLSGRQARDPGSALATRIAGATGAKVMTQGSTARMERGAGRVALGRVPYASDLAVQALAGFKHVILVGAEPPIAFFAYPGRPSELTPPGCHIHVLAKPEEDGIRALTSLADELGARNAPLAFASLATVSPAIGAITPENLARSLAAMVPENAILIDEALTAGRYFFPSTMATKPHTWLPNTGGSIGLGLPMAIGAAVACPDRKVIALQADGSAMYTVQALWTMAREALDVTIMLLSNRAYAILRGELASVGANPGRKALDMLDLGRPDIEWANLGRSLGVPGEKVTDMTEFNTAFARGIATPGPYLVEIAL